MNNYANNLNSMDNLRKVNKKIIDIENSLERKYISNKFYSRDLKKILDESINRYFIILKNLECLIE